MARVARSVMPKKKKQTIRTPKFVDEKFTGPEPEWDNAESWPASQYYKERVRTTFYYNYFYTQKEGKPWVLEWMKRAGYKKDEISAVRSVPDSYVSMTVCSYCRALIKGMPEEHVGMKDYLSTLPGVSDTAVPNAKEYVIGKIKEYLSKSTTIKVEKEEKEPKKDVPKQSVQELTREKAFAMTEELETFIDGFDYKKTSLRDFDPLGILRKNEAKPLHANIIMKLYKKEYDELIELTNPPARMTAEKKADYEQLKEGYNHLKKAEIDAYVALFRSVLDACEMIVNEGKVNRAPRKKKPVSKEKLVTGIKYCVSHEETKLVSAKPIDLLGAVAALVYNVKTRKLGIYIAQDAAGFTIKGASLVGFDEDKSVQKTLRKPVEQLAPFKKVTRRALPAAFEAIKSVETKMNGRFSDQIVIVKVF
jgi:hypothetical protein